MKYLLDTNICIYIIKKKPSAVIERLLKNKIGDIAISVITLCELEYGVGKSSKRVLNKLALTEFLYPLNILNYDDNAAICYGKIRADLEQKGQIIGPMDLLIASHALSSGLILVTNNEKEFKRIEKLKIESWL